MHLQATQKKMLRNCVALATKRHNDVVLLAQSKTTMPNQAESVATLLIWTLPENSTQSFSIRQILAADRRGFSQQHNSHTTTSGRPDQKAGNWC